MTWTIELLVEQHSSTFQWITLMQDQFFELQQKLTDTTTPRTKLVKRPSKNGLNERFYSGCLRFRYFPEFCDEANIQFRIITAPNMSPEKTAMILAVSEDHPTISDHWTALEKLIFLFQNVGLDPCADHFTVGFNAEDWLQFLLLQISVLDEKGSSNYNLSRRTPVHSSMSQLIASSEKILRTKLSSDSIRLSGSSSGIVTPEEPTSTPSKRSRKRKHSAKDHPESSPLKPAHINEEECRKEDEIQTSELPSIVLEKVDFEPEKQKPEKKKSHHIHLKKKIQNNTKKINFQRSKSQKIIPLQLDTINNRDETSEDDKPSSAREESKGVFAPLPDDFENQINKHETMEAFQSFGLQERMLQARSCFAITMSETCKRVIGGLLMLSDEHLCFLSKKTEARLCLSISGIEKIQRNQFDQYPNCLIVRNYQQQQFIFAGVGNTKRLMDSCDKVFTRKWKALSKVLQKRAKTVVQPNSAPPRKFSLFKKRLAVSAPTSGGLQHPTTGGVNAGHHNEPVFSLYCDLSLLHDYSVCDCILIAPPLFDVHIHSTLYVGGEMSMIVSAQQRIMVDINYMKIDSIEHGVPGQTLTTSDPEGEVLISFDSLPSALVLQGVSRSLANLLIANWRQKTQQNRSSRELCYMDGTQNDASLNKLKQEYILSQLPEPSEHVSALWKQYFRCHGKLIFRTDLLRRLVLAGIPHSIRAEVWCWLVSEPIKRVDSTNLSFGLMVSHFKRKKSISTSEIKRDIHRSFPEHPYYQKKEGRKSLELVLRMYSWRNPSVGYCQSMNLICGLLLLFMPDDTTYRLLSVICEEMLPNYFTPSMDGALTDQQILRSFICEYLPEIHKQFMALDVPIAVITFPWFLCLFIRCLPLELNMRVLDLFFARGRKILFQVALTIFRLNESAILSASDGTEIIFAIKNSMSEFECDRFIQHVFEFEGITEARIEQLWFEHQPQVLKEIAQVNKSKGSIQPPANSVFDADVVPVEEEPIVPVKTEEESPIRSGITFGDGVKAAEDDDKPATPTTAQTNPRRRFATPPVAQNSFRLRQSNAEIHQLLAQAKKTPEVSHTTASLIYLLREGFTGDVIEQEPAV